MAGRSQSAQRWECALQACAPSAASNPGLTSPNQDPSSGTNSVLPGPLVPAARTLQDGSMCKLPAVLNVRVISFSADLIFRLVIPSRPFNSAACLNHAWPSHELSILFLNFFWFYCFSASALETSIIKHQTCVHAPGCPSTQRLNLSQQSQCPCDC